MSDDPHDTIGNAAEIIERFGGIRPMATKLGVPVTTVQGWKQRNAIPMNRRDDIIRVSKELDVDVGGLLTRPVTTGERFYTEPLQSVRREKYETRLPKDSYSRPLFYATALTMVGVAIATVFMLAPKVREISMQEKQIQELQAKLEEARIREAEIQKKVSMQIPSGVEKTLTDVQHRVEELSKQAQGYNAAIEDLKTGTMPQRIAKLEGHVNQILGNSNAVSLSAMLNKVQAMQQSPQGSDALSGVVTAMLGEIGGDLGGEAASKPGTPTTEKKPASSSDIGAALQKLRETDPDVAKTLEGVAPEDVKAAAMLIGLAQLRQSLARNNDSFDSDLALLKKTAAKDDPALQEAIDRLAPQAKKGVLTPNGLSQEFRGLAGDIVSASLSGEDVSIEDKVKARLNDVMIVEKSGEQISGTPTQKTITEAQKMLDQGNVQGAITTLQTLDGPAATKAQPFIAQAQATVLAGQVQQALGQNALKQLIGSATLAAQPGAAGQNSLGALVSQINGMVPGQGMISDPGSGYSIYVQQPLHLPGQ